jgi:hypothetical protein
MGRCGKYKVTNINKVLTMAKREKLVYKNYSEMSHEWATNPDRNIRCGNGFVEDKVIYSYERHFPVAKIVEDKGGNKIVYMTLDTYSSTTAGHIRDTESAVSHLKKLYMLHVPRSAPSNYDHERNIGYWVGKIKEDLGKIDKAREWKSGYLSSPRGRITQIEKYIEHFKIKLDKETKKVIKDAQDTKWDKQIEEYQLKVQEKKAYELAHWPEISAKREADKAKRAIAKEKAEKKKWEEDIAKWRSGKKYRLSYNYRGGVLLRYDEQENRIMTSKNVYVPVEAAKKLYNRVQKVLKQGGCSDNCNDKILDYQVKEISTEQLVIGCHTIPITECDLIAQQLQW